MRALSVTEFLRGVNDVLTGVPAFVEGELSGFAIRQERWAFFSLKDERAVVECFMPAWKIRHEVADGMLVRVAGVSQVYAKSGRFRIVVEALEPVGEGSLKRAFELLKQKLEHEGFFAPGRKRQIPRFPETMGLIASTESAAYTDFLRILGNRWGGVRVLVQDVAVQGASAVEDIARAFARWRSVEHPPAPRSGRAHAKPELLVVVRGGGSLEDLQAFNSEAVARAIFASPIPVVVGVGHERDVTIADLVADQRASTPSNAAELVVPDRRDVANEIHAMVEQSEGVLRLAVARARTGIERFIGLGVSFARSRSAHVAAAAASMAARIQLTVRAGVNGVVAMERLIASQHPDRLLARGYSMTFAHGKIVRDARAVASGDVLRTRLGQGVATSRVE